MAAKKSPTLIVILLAVSVNLPLAFAQSAATDRGQARYPKSADCNASQRRGNPEPQWTRLLKDPLPISNAREENLLLAESVSPDSIDRPTSSVAGSCHVIFVVNNPKTANGGEFVLDGYCDAYLQGCGPFLDHSQCPPGAKARDRSLKSCGFHHFVVDSTRACSE